MKVQDILMEIWFSRNEALHNDADSTIHKKKHKTFNQETVERVFEAKPAT